MIRLAIPASELNIQVELYGPAAGLVPYDVEAISRLLRGHRGEQVRIPTGPRVEDVIDQPATRA